MDNTKPLSKKEVLSCVFIGVCFVCLIVGPIIFSMRAAHQWDKLDLSAKLISCRHDQLWGLVVPSHMKKLRNCTVAAERMEAELKELHERKAKGG